MGSFSNQTISNQYWILHDKLVISFLVLKPKKSRLMILCIFKGGVTVKAYSRKFHFQFLKSFAWKTNKNSTANRFLSSRNIVYKRNFVILSKIIVSKINFSKILVLREWVVTCSPPLIVQEKFYIRKISFFTFLSRFLFSAKKVVKSKNVARVFVYIFAFDHFFRTKQKT